MKLDLKNLICPEPIIRLKKAIDEAKIGEQIELSIDSEIVLNNVKRFLQTNEFKFDETKFCFIKTHNLDNSLVDEKVIYLNDDKVGDELVGYTLLDGFLKASLNFLPKYVICVNKAVLIATNRSHQCYKALEELERNEVKVLVCGSCLKAYKLVDKLLIGNITNLFEVTEILNNYKVVRF